MHVKTSIVLLVFFVNVIAGDRIVNIHEKTDNPSDDFVRRSGLSGFDSFVYWGGPVISNVKIVMVLWGSGTYAPYVTQQNVSVSMGNFYRELVKSSWIDWLSEYNTDTQNIGRGSYLGQYTITPSHIYSTVSDEFIAEELHAQIDAHNLPTNDDNTLYQLHFPRNVDVSLYDMTSCVDFCAYHSTASLPTPGLYYSIIPDFSSASGCFTGCGHGTEFSNVCSVSSHEIAEAITDPGVGMALDYEYPLAWYSPTYGETADLCNALQGSFLTANGTKYTVQKVGSNRARACVENCLRSLSLSQKTIKKNNKWNTIHVNYDDALCPTAVYSSHRVFTLTVTSSDPSRDSADIVIVNKNQFRVRASAIRTFIVTIDITNASAHARASGRILLNAI